MSRDYVVAIMAAILRASPSVNPTTGAPASLKACVSEAYELLDMTEEFCDDDEDEDDDEFEEEEDLDEDND